MTDVPDAERTPKKTEVLEVRIAPETKRAFMAACREEGRSASDRIREMIEDFLAARRRSPRGEPLMAMPLSILMQRRLPFAAPFVAAGAAAVFLGLQAGAATSFAEAAFMRRDADRNGTLTLDEFLPDFSAAITPRALAPECRAALIEHGRMIETAAFKALDEDASGGLSLEEFSRNEILPSEEMVRAQFDFADTDDDGALDRGEHAAWARPSFPPEFPSGSPPSGGVIAAPAERVVLVDPPPGTPLAPAGTMTAGTFVKPLPGPDAEGAPPALKACAASANKSDVVLFIAAPRDADASFAAADVNADGRITFEEFVAQSPLL